MNLINSISVQIGSTNYQSQVLNSTESLSSTLTNNFVGTSANYTNNNAGPSTVTPRPLQNVKNKNK